MAPGVFAYTVDLYSNDGSTLIEELSIETTNPYIYIKEAYGDSGGLPAIVVNSSTVYYSEILLGIAASPNATTPDYGISESVEVTGGESFYIVEGGENEAEEPAPTPTATFDLSTLNLSAGAHSVYVKLNADGYSESEASNAVEYTVEANTYNITTTLSGCTGYSTNPTEIDEGETVELYFEPQAYCALPTSVYVTGAEYDWYWTSGYLILRNPTGPVYISISSPNVDSSFTDWVVGSAPQITFTCEGVQYTAEEGMTFKHWIRSTYNTGGYEVCTGIMAGEYCDFVHGLESGTDVLVNKNNTTVRNNTVITDGEVYTADQGFLHDVTDKGELDGPVLVE